MALGKVGRPPKNGYQKAVARAILEMDLGADVLERLNVAGTIPVPKIPGRLATELSQYFRLAMELAVIQDREEDLTAGIWTE